MTLAFPQALKVLFLRWNCPVNTRQLNMFSYLVNVDSLLWINHHVSWVNPLESRFLWPFSSSLFVCLPGRVAGPRQGIARWFSPRTSRSSGTRSGTHPRSAKQPDSDLKVASSTIINHHQPHHWGLRSSCLVWWMVDVEGSDDLLKICAF